jgi:hypothetical protein
MVDCEEYVLVPTANLHLTVTVWSSHKKELNFVQIV